MDNINRLLSGICIVRVQDQIVHIYPFPVDKKTEADFFANELYEELITSGYLLIKHVDNFLLEQGLWSQEQTDKISELDNQIEQIKVDYFKNFARKEFRGKIKKTLEFKEEEKRTLLSNRISYYDKTCEHIRDYNKTLFLLRHSSYVNGKLIANDFNLLMLVGAYSKNLLKEEDIRNVAKSPEWRTIWGASKDAASIFSNRICDLTNEQLSLVSWSRFYDNINESPDRPTEEVMQDNIALDGWAILQNRKRKEEELKRSGERLLSDKMQNATEIILPARNEQEMREIYSLNDYGAKKSIDMMGRDLKKHGSVKEQDLTYTRQQVQMMSNDMSRRK